MKKINIIIIVLLTTVLHSQNEKKKISLFLGLNPSVNKEEFNRQIKTEEEKKNLKNGEFSIKIIDKVLNFKVSLINNSIELKYLNQPTTRKEIELFKLNYYLRLKIKLEEKYDYFNKEIEGYSYNNLIKILNKKQSLNEKEAINNYHIFFYKNKIILFNINYVLDKISELFSYSTKYGNKKSQGKKMYRMNMSISYFYYDDFKNYIIPLIRKHKAHSNKIRIQKEKQIKLEKQLERQIDKF